MGRCRCACRMCNSGRLVCPLFCQDGSAKERACDSGASGLDGALGWVGSQLAPKAGPTACASLPLVTSQSRLLVVAQTADSPQTPRRWWEGDTALSVFSACRVGLWGGLGHRVRAQWHTFVPLQQAAVLLLAGEKVCVPGAPGPRSRAGEPYTVAAGGSVGQVTCGFLQPTTEPRGLWSEVLLD